MHLLSDSDDMRFFYQWYSKIILVSTLWMLVTVSNVTSTKYELLVSTTNQTTSLTCSTSRSRSLLEASMACEDDQACHAVWSHTTEGGQLHHGLCHCMKDPVFRSQIVGLDPGLHTKIVPKFNKGMLNECSWILCFILPRCLLYINSWYY